MAVNSASTYGTDIRCLYDADAFFSAATGLESVRQDAFHRIMVDDVLGPQGEGWGKDVRRLLGMPARELVAQQPVFATVLLKDPRIQSADVTIAATITNGMADVRFAASCTSALGPFDVVIDSVASLTARVLAGLPL